ncbi:histidine kinase [Eggerthella lenta]|uniref:Hpt domain-containing protein n=1 Tax=Eggerthella lenta TaxID=84112 RepID=UPI000DF86482|nr:Hpt domain-containing protein [Eggerthella lenta]RDC42386.1 histidine kinase [Eggerthella lenta]
MTNDQTAMLARYGIDYAEAMERFCGNESLFARIAVKYLDDPHVDALEAAMASGDAAAAEREAHSLKGVAGNLSFVCLYDLAARVTDALRANDIDSARTLMPDLRESHVAVSGAKNLEEWGLSTSMR